MKTIRLKKWPYFYVKPINNSGSIVIERAEEPFRIPDNFTIEKLEAIWNYRQLALDYELTNLPI